MIIQIKNQPIVHYNVNVNIKLIVNSQLIVNESFYASLPSAAVATDRLPEPSMEEEEPSS